MCPSQACDRISKLKSTPTFAQPEIYNFVLLLYGQVDTIRIGDEYSILYPVVLSSVT